MNCICKILRNHFTVVHFPVPFNCYKTTTEIKKLTTTSPPPHTQNMATISKMLKAKTIWGFKI